MTGQVLQIPLNEIYADAEFNCRGQISPTDVIELAKDIEANGLIQPVTITTLPEDKKDAGDYKYLLVAGYRRYTAHRVLKREMIDCIFREDMADMEKATFFNLSENVQRKDLTILQEAQALKRLRELGIGEHAAAERLNKSRGWVQIRYMLLSLPSDIQKEVESGVITQSQVRELYTIKNYGSKEDLYDAARKLKEAKASGRTQVTARILNKQRKNAKRVRGKAELMEMMELLIDKVGYGIHTRILAWASGEIDDIEIHTSIKEHLAKEGKEYEVPGDIKV